MEKIAEKLKYVRETIGKTQVEMSKELNCSKQIYNNLEKAKRRLQVEEVIFFKNKFNINPNWLICDEGNMMFEENMKYCELTNLILDYREYGGEVDIVRKEIIKKILRKFYKQKTFFFLFKKESHKFGNRPYFIFIKVLRNCAFSGDSNLAKNYLRDKIKSFNDNSSFLISVKKELYALLENIDNKDCHYLLKNPSLVEEVIKSKEKNLELYMKIDGYFNGNG